MAVTIVATSSAAKPSEVRIHRADRHARALVVVADCGDDGRHVARRHVHVFQDAEGHHRAALRMLDAVDEVADIVQIARDARQLHLVFGVAQRLQDIRRRFGYARNVREAVLGKPERFERFVGAGDIGFNFFVVLNIFKCNHFSFLLYCARWHRRIIARSSAASSRIRPDLIA